MRISFATAQKLIANYKQNHWPVINGACPSLQNNPAFPNVQDSRSVWFSLTELGDFMSAIHNVGGNGIRIYFGEYSADIISAAQAEIANGLPAVDTHCDNSLNGVSQNINQYTGMQTIVMVPTIRDNTNNVNLDCTLNPLNTTFDLQETSLSALNHGGMAPPPPITSVVTHGTTYAQACGAAFLDL